MLGLPEIDWASIGFPIWERNKGGDNFYDLTSVGEWTSSKSNLGMALNHPILTPALLFISKLMSQAEFRVKEPTTGKLINTHPVLDLLRKPNHYQTLQDFIESLSFMTIANGVGVVWKKRILSLHETNALYILDYNKIKWPDSIKTGHFKNANISERKLNTEIIYDELGENISIKLRDLMFFYDLPNAVDKNPFKTSSRLDGLKQTLINTHDSLVAKNIILRSNGKELISGGKNNFPLDPDEKKEIEALFNSKYGLSATRKRGVITKADVTWKSMHIALRDLGLDESVKIDGNIIYTALHIPKDIISLEAKKTTYNNFKESMVSYIQNEIQPTLNSFIAIFQSLIEDEFELVGSYEHMPIMQFILIERYEGVEQRAIALSALRNAGLPDKIALEMVGLDTSLTLTPVIATEPSDNSSSNGKANEEKILEIVENYLN